jgi:hypothetical protein
LLARLDVLNRMEILQVAQRDAQPGDSAAVALNAAE